MFDLQTLSASGIASPALLMAFGVALLASFAQAYTLRKLDSEDKVVAAGWGVGGTVALGSGWWSAELFALMGAAPSVQLRGEVLFACWGIAMASAGTVLMAAALLPAGWRRGCILGVLLALAQGLTLRALVAAPALQPMLSLEDERVQLVLLAGFPLCLLGALLMTVSARPEPEPVRRRVLSGVGVMAAGMGVMQAIAFTGLAQGTQPADGDMLLSVAAAQRLGAAGALAVGMLLLSALVDMRSRGRTRELAASLHDANQQLRQLAFCDPLTGLPNRLLFEERLHIALEHVGRLPSGLAVLFIDLDGFKPINDSFGHAAGDEVLRQVGRRLEALAGERETIARVGGDEFLMLLEQPEDPTFAADQARRILRALNHAYKLPNAIEVSLSCSIGIALFPQHGPMAKLIANADAAMYAAKGVGGTTFAFFEPRMDLDVREQVELQRDLRLAMERRELQLYYQPKVDSRTADVTGAEALVRWQHPTRGTVTPQQFIPVAERFGLIGGLGAWVIDEACRQVRAWLDEGLRIRVAVNLSVHQLRQEDLVPRIRRALLEHQVEPRLLSFEITESVAMEDTAATLRAFSQLAHLGVMLAIDDFGTGHSSLAYLRKLPARQLKIDRSFVADLEHSADALAVVDAVVSLAHALGLRVVAEGVESEAQRDLLIGLRCDELQGFLIAKPMAPKSLALWVMEDTAPTKVEFQGRLWSDTVRSQLH